MYTMSPMTPQTERRSRPDRRHRRAREFQTLHTQARLKSHDKSLRDPQSALALKRIKQTSMIGVYSACKKQILPQSGLLRDVPEAGLWRLQCLMS